MALQRGPIVYCLEQCDHKGTDVRTLVLPDAARLAACFDARSRPIHLKAVPCCLWDNRAAGSMSVWMPRA